jgi:hypothetical protein
MVSFLLFVANKYGAILVLWYLAAFFIFKLKTICCEAYLDSRLELSSIS